MRKRSAYGGDMYVDCTSDPEGSLVGNKGAL